MDELQAAVWIPFGEAQFEKKTQKVKQQKTQKHSEMSLL